MSELKSWGVQRNHFNFIRGCSCPYCDKDYDIDKDPQQIVGFATNCPSFSERTQEKEVIGTLMVECTGCFEKFWLYVSNKMAEKLRKICDNWP